MKLLYWMLLIMRAYVTHMMLAEPNHVEWTNANNYKLEWVKTTSMECGSGIMKKLGSGIDVWMHNKIIL